MSNRFAGLDALRGIASLYVMIGHLVTFQYAQDIHTTLPFAHLFVAGYLGVDLFFVLSGFVMAHAYPRVAGPRFYVRRFARLAPLHLMTLLVLAFAVRILDGGPAGRFSVHDFWLNAANLQLLAHSANWNYPSWSISHEMIAYAVFPAVTAALAAGLSRRAGLAFLACMAWTASFYVLIGHESDAAIYGLGALNRSLPLFVAGCMLRQLLERPGAWNQIGRLPVLLGIGVFLVGAVITHFSRWYCVWGAPLALIIASRPSGALAWLLVNPVTEFLGRISFGMYMIHGVVEFLVGAAAVHLNGGVAPHLGMMAGIVVVLASGLATIGLAWASARWLEAPAMREVRRVEAWRRASA